MTNEEIQNLYVHLVKFFGFDPDDGKLILDYARIDSALKDEWLVTAISEYLRDGEIDYQRTEVPTLSIGEVEFLKKFIAFFDHRISVHVVKMGVIALRKVDPYDRNRS